MELLKVKVGGQWVEVPSIKGEKGEKGDAFTYADFTEAQKLALIQGPIKTAQDAAVQVVEDAGSDQVDAVEAKGEEVRESIPSDYTELSENVSALNSAITQLNDNVITESAGPASIVSIKDGADGMPLRNLSVAVEPVQDLHGYDHPWPDGGGKNLLPLKLETIKRKGSWDGNRLVSNGVTFVILTDSANNVIGINMNGTATNGFAQIALMGRLNTDGTEKQFTFSGATGGSSESYYVRFVARDSNNSAVIIDGGLFIDVFNGQTTKTIPANVAYIEGYVGVAVNGTANDVIVYPMIRLATETDSTFEPYTNICPISGWTGAKIFHCADNLYDKDSVQLHKNWIGGDAVDRAYLTVPVTPGETYNISIIGCSTAKYVSYIEMDRPIAGTQSYFGTINTANVNFTRTVTNTYIGLQFNYNKELTKQEVDSVQISISKGGFLNQVDITFPSEAGTVYGGTLDVTTGVLTVDRAMVDIGSLNFARASSRFYATVENGIGISPQNVYSACEIYAKSIVNWTNIPDFTFTYGPNISGRGRCLAINDPRYTAEDEFKTAMNGVKLVYGIANPITYQLTPQEITTLLGANNIWADTGDTTVEYPADTKMYIDNKITQAIAAALNA